MHTEREANLSLAQTYTVRQATIGRSFHAPAPTRKRGDARKVRRIDRIGSAVVCIVTMCSVLTIIVGA